MKINHDQRDEKKTNKNMNILKKERKKEEAFSRLLKHNKYHV
jgi:hypothetical protein